MRKDTCEVGVCRNKPKDDERHRVITTDRDGGGTPMLMCDACWHAFKIGKHEGKREARMSEYR